jgi:hypothetical protein
VRLRITADLHFNHARSRKTADELIDQINAACAGTSDGILLVGDTAAFDGDFLERCLGRFAVAGPRLFVPGNHELWTAGPDSLRLLTADLPRRIADCNWHWLPGHPFIAPAPSSWAIVGNLGWYDYSYASPDLGIPRRFFEAKLTPGVAAQDEQYQHLLGPDVPPQAMNLIARWNDAKHIKLGMSDEAFLERCLNELDQDLTTVAAAKNVLVAVHNVPHESLLPAPHNRPLDAPPIPNRVPQGIWAFARAYLGSGHIAQLIQKYPNVHTIVCGHSHVPAEARLGPIRAINIGSGYGRKRFVTVEIGKWQTRGSKSHGV